MEKFTNWIDAFEKAKREPMRDGLGATFFKCCMNDNNPIPKEAEGLFIFQLIKKRAECLQMKMSDWAVLFLGALVKSPGEAVMYLYYLKGKGFDLTFNGITTAFPMGFVKEEDLEILWDLQKGNSGEGYDNLLDTNLLNLWLLNREEYEKAVAQ